ncbi:MAG: hypothetical protein HOO91_03215 [Bacteroidales bacterium]|nr:hypothetical protein [Bacteroidales bacterium]
MQIYKKVLLFLLITSFMVTNEGCHKKNFPLFHRKRLEQYSPSKQFHPYDVKKTENTKKRTLNRIEKKRNRKSERNKRKALKAQEIGRQEHIKKQSPEIQERMKKSLEESKKLRRHKTFWGKIMFWRKNINKEKKL